MGKHYVGEVGTVIRLDCGSDVSAATSKYIYCDKPDGTRVTWTAELDGTNYIQYTVTVGDLGDPGTYRVQAGISQGSWTGRGETATFEITPIFM